MKLYPVLVFIITIFINQNFAQTSPLVLTQPVKEMTAQQYYELSTEAELKMAAGDNKTAADLYAKLVNAYSLDGENWARLGRVRYRLGDYRGAIEALKRGIELGHGFQGNLYSGFIQRSMYAVAAAYAQLGETDNALDWLEKSIKEHRYERRPGTLEDPAFEKLRSNPRFKQIVGLAPENRRLTRDEGWRYDLDYLLSEIKRLNPVYHSRPLPVDLQRAADDLRRDIPRLSDAQIAVELQHLLRLLGHSHNTLYFPYAGGMSGRVKFTQLPTDFYAFPDGIYIIDAQAPYEDLIGSRIIRFDDIPAEEALEAVRRVKDHENDVEVLSSGMAYLPIPQVLHALGLTKQPDRVVLTLTDKNGRTKTISPTPTEQRTWQRISVPRLPNIPPPPSYLQEPNNSFRFENLSDGKTTHVIFNQVQNKADESLDGFGLRLRKNLAENGIKNLIIDVRRNNGGDTYMYSELLRTLIWFDARDGKKMFVIIGRRTFSATANFITEVDRLTNAVFVGEPSGGKPLTIGGDSADITLPYSGLRGGLSSASWQLTSPRDTRPYIAPDIPVVLTAKDYFANRDPVMETLIKLIVEKP